MKFKIGDIVIGNAKADCYGITCPGRRGIVIEINEEVDEIVLKCYPEDRDGFGHIWSENDEFQVDPECFDLWEDIPQISLSDYLIGGTE